MAVNLFLDTNEVDSHEHITVLMSVIGQGNMRREPL